MPHVAWTLTDYSADPESPEVFQFPINPNEFEPPGRQARIVTEMGTSPSGQAIFFQGRDQISHGRMSGIVNSEQFYNDLSTWADKWYVLELTDDQSRTWDIIIQSISWTRIRRANNQSRFDYTIDFIGII